MIKKIFTLSLAFFLVCNTSNALEFKLQNNSPRPIFYRLFEKKNNVYVPSLKKFTLLTLDSKRKVTCKFDEKIYLCVSFMDPASNEKLQVKIFQIDKSLNCQINDNNFSIGTLPLSIGTSLPFLKSSTDYITNNWFTLEKDNLLGKFGLVDPQKENTTLAKNTTTIKIQKPTIIDNDQPLPQTIEVFENSY